MSRGGRGREEGGGLEEEQGKARQGKGTEDQVPSRRSGDEGLERGPDALF